ncbi:MAG: aminotransferase class V-fold PLP-dependent enzyme [Deltaproteobacteria bacterium]|nr:aminotransferase class V-fold PLP-dependent enzyme [Deltaproteobacteria bacterium]MBW2678212.1 aminotransferase class V-fold PLP-dependent enzyme [Deltaproteobacteria bacterium]
MATKTTEEMMAELESSIKPYKKDYHTYSHLPATGRKKETIIGELEALKAAEESKWKNGLVSGAVYHGAQDHIDFLNEVYALTSQTNPLHTDVWPSITKFEAEVISMTANMMSAEKVNDVEDADDEVCGALSSGGTESILLAMKTYRDWAREMKGIRNPEMIVPSTAHAAFDKASQYFNIKMKRIPVDENFKADIEKTRDAITPNTIVIVGSTPSFPHGVIDPIEALSELAREEDIGFHTDACLGGFILPWAEKLGYEVPLFDFRLPGVTSISVDTHKYGYAAKGSSIILYRNPELRRYQFYTTTDWPGGLYLSPTFAGSRSGALSAAAWAAMLSIGEEGYLANTKKILEAAAVIKDGIRDIPELYLLGDALWDIAFSSKDLNIYKVMDYMGEKKWSLNGLQNPAAVHICLTLRHAQEGLPEKFITDLKSAVESTINNPGKAVDGAGRLYGMSANIPIKGVVDAFLKRFLDLLFKL